MRSIFALIFFAFSFSLHASVIVSVEVPISIDKETTMQNARAKAVHESVDKLPSIIWGQESASNHSYHQSIKAIGFAHADVDLINEYWDHQNKTLRIEASVSWNEEKVLSTLKQVQDGELAKRTVSQIEKILNGISARDFIDNAAYRKLEEARLLATPFHFGMDLKTYVARYNETLNEMINIRRQRINDYIAQIKITPTGMKNQMLHYEISFPNYDFLTLHFESDDLQKFHDDNKQAIEDGYRLCAVTPSVLQNNETQQRLDLKRDFLNQRTKPSTLTVSIAPIPAIVDGRLAPINFLPCHDRKMMP